MRTYRKIAHKIKKACYPSKRPEGAFDPCSRQVSHPGDHAMLLVQVFSCPTCQ